MWGLPYYYYNGDAREPNVQEAIKSQFHSLMRLPYIPPGFCSIQPKCTKDSILVSPGVIGICMLLFYSKTRKGDIN